MDRQKFNKRPVWTDKSLTKTCMDRHKFNKIPVWIDKNLTKTYMDRQKIPVWIDKELSAIVEGNLLPTILASATVDE